MTGGNAGNIQEVATITTSASSTMSGNFQLAWDYEDGFSKALGNVAVTQGSREVTGTSFDANLRRGDMIKIGSEVFRVSTDVHDAFTATKLFLGSYYVGATSGSIAATTLGSSWGAVTITGTNNIVTVPDGSSGTLSASQYISFGGEHHKIASIGGF